MKNIQSKLIDYIKDNTGTSFVEIEKVFDENDFDYKGQGAYTSSKNSNIVFWYGWNERAFDAVSELVNDGVIEMSKCESMIYIVDGKSLNFPILKLDDVDTYHWLPVTFNIVKEITHG
ncbi:pathogenicity island protein [Staphylococcus haemolyticus]|uniref:pathogenicity island protein n=1 Tax=Staphylococcus haemolyticus TaxID=1283 RepID=UPI001F0ACEB0|nr:pathogenicity island protein [Staphylococcus haemolyticus]MCH4331172.1 pathogenicity island protein [Staphylococcus haemolyticus]MCH4338237.1 pathogenicity island protein [Staphylococcus haemolyticus]MCH4342839.1 pathogenicity island protein [Staphylococcus haemolyticus]MCH4345179.1 pathogenicity island protein [Staphylococcus haemolyticus]MCH4395815.1 pathogenicity island protein [Staphylococcus haemolyticus]